MAKKSKPTTMKATRRIEVYPCSGDSGQWYYLWVCTRNNQVTTTSEPYADRRKAIRAARTERRTMDSRLPIPIYFWAVECEVLIIDYSSYANCKGFRPRRPDGRITR